MTSRFRFYAVVSIFSLAIFFYHEFEITDLRKQQSKIVEAGYSDSELKRATNLPPHKEHLFVKMNLGLPSRTVNLSGTTRKIMQPIVVAAIARKIYDQHNNSNSSESSEITNVNAMLDLESIERRYRWIAQANTLPNYFLSPRASEKKDNQEINNDNENSPISFQYKNSTVVFLHHNKAAGTTTKTCLQKIAFTSKLIQVSQANIFKMPAKTIVSRHLANDQKRRVMMGGYSFGLCDRVQDKCAYFTFLRDPWNRLISSYEYCKRSIPDQLCVALNANTVSIKEWALNQGSFFFRQLIYKPDFCSNKRKEIVKTPFSRYPAPCWYRQKVQLDKLLTKFDLEQIFSYVLSKLEQWFAVIGLVEDYQNSTKLLQEAFGLPFHSLCFDKVSNSGQRWLKDEEREKLRLELMNDPQVNEAMSFDLRIYKAAQDIFRRQKEAYMQQK